MSTQFSILNEHEAILISMTGHVSEEDINEMRQRTTEIAAETGFSRFVMDIEDVLSIAEGSPFAVFELGSKFRSSGFPLQTQTAVIMPTDAKAREQAELMHTVQVNRGRGRLQYVDSLDDGLAWVSSCDD